MKILIRNTKIIGTATDDYTEPESFITAPDGFDISRMDEYRYENGVLILVPKPMTRLTFLRRFTAQERIAIRASNDPLIADFLHLLEMAQDIDLTDADTQMGVGYLEQQALIAEGRAVEILTP